MPQSLAENLKELYKRVKSECMIYICLVLSNLCTQIYSTQFLSVVGYAEYVDLVGGAIDEYAAIGRTL